MTPFRQVPRHALAFVSTDSTGTPFWPATNSGPVVVNLSPVGGSARPQVTSNVAGTPWHRYSVPL